MPETWRLVQRLSGCLNGKEWGQSERAPIVRRRRLSEGAPVRVQARSAARLNLAADRSGGCMPATCRRWRPWRRST
jgi:hypothetical protein